MLKEDEKNQIAKILSERVGNFVCPICGKGHFSLVDGYSSQGLNEDYRKTILSTKVIPFVMLVCDNCGFISQHALGTLGLLNKDDNKSQETPKEE